jgi:hypothetical protein
LTRSGFPWLTITQKAYTNQNNRVKIVRHAVAIDEQRTYFQPSLWEPGQDYEEWSQEVPLYEKRPQDFEEVWFTGCHCDVGGGYPDAKSGLAKIPLEWLYREAEAAGVAGMRRSLSCWLMAKGASTPVKAAIWPATRPSSAPRTTAGPDPLADINKSMNGAAGRSPNSCPARSRRLVFRIRFRIGKFYIPLFDHRRRSPRAPSCTKR